MPPIDIASMQMTYQLFQQTMRLDGGVCSPFTQELWARWQGESDHLLCELIGARWLLFRRSGRSGFVAHLMTQDGIAELTQDIAMTQSVATYGAQAQHTLQTMSRAGLQCVRDIGRQREREQGIEFVLPMLNELRSATGCYSIFGISGQHRIAQTGFHHAISIDGVDPFLLDSGVGFSDFPAMNPLVDGLYKWLGVLSRTFLFDVCLLRSFRDNPSSLRAR